MYLRVQEKFEEMKRRKVSSAKRKFDFREGNYFNFACSRRERNELWVVNIRSNSKSSSRLYYDIRNAHEQFVCSITSNRTAVMFACRHVTFNMRFPFK